MSSIHDQIKQIIRVFLPTGSTKGDSKTSQHDWKIVGWDIKKQNKRQTVQQKTVVWTY